jgi:hypothetical protein
MPVARSRANKELRRSFPLPLPSTSAVLTLSLAVGISYLVYHGLNFTCTQIRHMTARAILLARCNKNESSSEVVLRMSGSSY